MNWLQIFIDLASDKSTYLLRSAHKCLNKVKNYQVTRISEVTGRPKPHVDNFLAKFCSGKTIDESMLEILENFYDFSKKGVDHGEYPYSKL